MLHQTNVSILMTFFSEKLQIQNKTYENDFDFRRCAFILYLSGQYHLLLKPHLHKQHILNIWIIYSLVQCFPNLSWRTPWPAHFVCLPNQTHTI